MLNTPKCQLFQELHSAADRDNGKSSAYYVSLFFLIKPLVLKPNILVNDLTVPRNTEHRVHRTNYLKGERHFYWSFFFYLIISYYLKIYRYTLIAFSYFEMETFKYICVKLTTNVFWSAQAVCVRVCVCYNDFPPMTKIKYFEVSFS